MTPGSLQLAYVGDSVYDLYVRERLVRSGGRVKDLHRAAVERVCAAAQSRALERIEPMLTEDEQGIVRRARNARQTPTKSADAGEYHRATGLEALLGALYLAGETDRLNQLLEVAVGEIR